MATIALDPTYRDWALAAGKLTTFTDAKETAQRIASRLRFFRRQWFRDTRQGIPFWESVIGKTPDIGALVQFYRTIIAGVPGVKRIVSISADWNRTQRVVTLSFEAQHDSGAKIEGGIGKPFLVDGEALDLADIPEVA